MGASVHLPEGWSDWVVTDLVGSGSFGTVYKAERKLQNQTLYSAIKVIPVPPENENSSAILHEAGSEETAYVYYHEIVEDFEREIRNMDALKGITNIVSIEDYAVEKCKDHVGWLVYLRMEFLQCFSDYQLEHLVTEDDVIRLGIDICTALSYCEKAKILHRDVKPENIFVSKYGNFKLGDFGISRTFEKTVGTYTQNGTELYMAPEIVHNQRYGAAADQYSLGLVLYTLMNDNRMPLLSSDKQLPGWRERREALQKRLDGSPLPPPANADAGLSAIILRACAYRQEDRYPDAEAMRRALLKLQTERETAGSQNISEPVHTLLGNKTYPQEVTNHNSQHKNSSKLHGHVHRKTAIWVIVILAATVLTAAVIKLQQGSKQGLGQDSRQAIQTEISPLVESSSETEKETEPEKEPETETESETAVPEEVSTEPVTFGTTETIPSVDTDSEVSGAAEGSDSSKRGTKSNIPLYRRLTLQGSDDYLYFISENQQYGLYLDDSEITIEKLTDGKGSYSAFKGGAGDYSRGTYSDDGSTIRMTLAGGGVMEFPYTVQENADGAGGAVLSVKLGGLGQMELHQSDSMAYLDLSDVIGNMFG